MKIIWKRMKSKHYKRPQIKTKQILKRRVTTVLLYYLQIQNVEKEYRNSSLC